ncbi:MAG: hypothetical protein IOD12_12750 [Silvanigrellales bacterium]|jgi:hypothetical protein|nr:hypothetical protein [Silvanigrellales bacterium]
MSGLAEENLYEWRVAITVVDGFHLRYVVDSGVLSRFHDRTGASIDIFCSEVLEGRVRSVFEATGMKIRVLRLPKYDLTLLRRIFIFLRLHGDRRLAGTLNIKMEKLRRENRWKYLAIQAIRASSASYLHRLVCSALSWLTRSREVEAYFESTCVRTLLCSTPGQKFADVPFLGAAARRGIPSLATVYSWDNLTAKGAFIEKPDRLLVWNEWMKEEAVNYHGYDPAFVEVTGSPSYDAFARLRGAADANLRSVFFESLGFNPNLPLVSLCTIPPLYFGSCHAWIAREVLSAVDDGRLPCFQLLVRPHPLDSTDYASLDHPLLRVDCSKDSLTAPLANWVPGRGHLDRLAMTMVFSQVVLNIASTITIDACFFDTPVVTLAIDAPLRLKDYDGSVRRYYDYTHFKRVVECRAAPLVESLDELFSSIREALADPALRRSERAEVARSMCHVVDGTASEKMAESFSRFVNLAHKNMGAASSHSLLVKKGDRS